MIREDESERLWQRKRNSLEKIRAEIQQGKKKLQSFRADNKVHHIRQTQSRRPLNNSSNNGNSWEINAQTNDSHVNPRQSYVNNEHPSSAPRVVYDSRYDNYLRQRYPHLTEEKNSPQKSTFEAWTTAPSLLLLHSPALNTTESLNPSKLSEKLTEDTTMAAEIVSSLLNRFLEDDFVPDILIEILHEMSSSTSTEHRLPMLSPTDQRHVQVHQGTIMVIYHDLIREVVTSMISKMAVEQLDEAWEKVRHWDEVHRKISFEIVKELVDEEITATIRHNIRKLAQDEVKNLVVHDMRESILEESLEAMLPSLVRSSLGEAFLESIVDEILEPVIHAECLTVVDNVVSHYQEKLKRWDISQIATLLGGKPLEGLVLDHLLLRTVDQHVVFGPSAPIHKELEDIALRTLLVELDGVERTAQDTLSSYPLRRFHEKVFTDIAMDLLMKDLLQHVDADLCDLDIEEVEKSVSPDVKKYTHHVDDLYPKNA